MLIDSHFSETTSKQFSVIAKYEVDCVREDEGKAGNPTSRSARRIVAITENGVHLLHITVGRS